MADLEGHPKGFGHRDHLVDGREQLHGLLPHVDGQDGVRIADGLQGPDQLVGGVVAFRRVAEAQRHARRPVGEGLLEAPMDLGIVLVLQPQLLEPGYARSNGAAARQHEGVHRQGPGLQGAEVIGHGVHRHPLEVAGHRLEIGGDGLPVGPRLGGQGQAAVAVADGGDPLKQVAVPVAGPEQGPVRVAMEVQKAGAHYLPGGVHDLCRTGPRPRGDGGPKSRGTLSSRRRPRPLPPPLPADPPGRRSSRPGRPGPAAGLPGRSRPKPLR